MGIFLKALERQRQPKQGLDFFLSNSLSKIRQYYCLFKSISETYSIDTEQFAQLFGIKHQQIFQLLDTDHNLLIDGLELFSGLALLSTNVKFLDKVRFLFQLFDFNDLKSLSRTDLQFLFLSGCNAVAKIYNLKPYQDDSFVQEFVREEFPSDERVNISEMTKWAKKSQTVSLFFSLIAQPLQGKLSASLEQKIYFKLEPTVIEQHSLALTHLQQEQQRLMLRCQKIFNQEQQESDLQCHHSDISPKIQWVYGIRYKDVKQFLQYLSTPQEELLLYFIGKVAVIYSLNSRCQRHYCSHQNQIISIAVSGTLCATGQYSIDPEIRIWDYRTLQTIQILKGSHVQGVHLLKFLKGGLLVSCGSQQQSSVIIFDIESGSALFSTYCCSPAVQISLLDNFTNRSCNQFIIASLYSIYHFECVIEEESHSLGVRVSQLSGDIRSKITTCCFFMINGQFRHLKQYDEKIEKQAMSGHQNGSIYVWNIVKGQKQYFFSQQINQIVRIIPTHQHLLVITNSSSLAYYDIHLQQKERIRSIDITQIDHSLRSYDLAECLTANNGQLLIFTQTADIFFLLDQDAEQLPSLTHFTHRKFRTKSIQEILSIDGQIGMHKLITRDKEQLLYISIDHLIRAIDLQTHRFIKQWNIGQKIVSFDAISSKANGIILVAATDRNRLYSFSNTTQNIGKETIEGDIVSVFAHIEDNSSSIVILASTKTSIFRYNLSRGNFINSSVHAFPGLSPTITNFEGNKVLLSGKDNSIQALLVKQMHAQPLSELSNRSSVPAVKLFYHISQGTGKIKLPVIVGHHAKALVAARRDGKMHIWSNFNELQNHTPLVLDVHIAPISDVIATEDQKQLISSGSSDGLIIEWRIRNYAEKGSSVNGYKLKDEIIDNQVWMFANRRVQFCKFQNNLLGQHYDQHLQVRGINNETIRRLFRTNLNQWKVSNPMIRREQPSLHLKLDFAWGIQTYHKNNTVIALSDPKRFVYFVSKLVVIYNPALNSQNFYRGHRFKVTCFKLLDDKKRIASSEAAYRPTIHIWSINTLQTLRIIETKHRWGVIELDSRGSTLLSFGLKLLRQDDEDLKDEFACDKNIYSYQITDIDRGYIIAEREEKDLVHAIAIDHKNPHCFAACSQGKVTFWEIKFRTILRTKICWLGRQTPTCCRYYYAGKGPCQLLIGTRSGAVGMVSKKQHWSVFKKGEKDGKEVNCLLVIERETQTLIVAASEDNYLTIWNQKLQTRFREDMGRMELTDQGSKKIWQGKGEKLQRNCSIQSLSQIQMKGQLRILLATRNGEVLQLVQSKEYARFSNNKTINFKAVLFLRFNLGKNQVKAKSKVLIAHHPRYQILATIGVDQQLLFWDSERHRLLHSAYLGLDRQKSYPTALKFSYTGDYLMVGYSDGLLVFLDSKLSKSIQGKADEKYSPPSLNMVKKQKAEEGHAVLNMELSENGQFLAVSYHRLAGQKSHAYIQLFASKLKDKPRNYTRFQNDKIFEHYSTVPCPHAEKAYRGQTGIAYGFAAHAMAFAECENKHYFLIYFQLLDEFQNRLAITSQGEQERNYKVWDVSSSTVIANSSLIQSIRWKKFYIHNAILTQYLIHQPHLLLNYHQQAQPTNNNLLLPQFTNMTLLENYMVATSLNGDLHIMKLSALQGESNQKDDSEDSQNWGGLVAKTIPGHSCKIDQIETNHDKTVLYTTGESDECVLKWIVEEGSGMLQDEQWQQDQKDLLGEVLDTEQLHIQMQLWNNKFKTGKKVVRNQGFIEWLRVSEIFGRRAQQVRNNLKYDKHGRLIYISGHAVVMYDSLNQVKQFIYVKNDSYNLIQEITAMELTKQREFLFTCHAGNRASVKKWQLSSKTLLTSLYFDQLSYILYLAISDDNSRLLLYGITPQNTGQLLLVDLHNSQLLAVCSYIHKRPWHIKALGFIPNSHDKFVTCGIEQTKSWQFQGGQLIYSNMSNNQSTKINTCLTFLGEQLVTGNDRGQLVIWKTELIQRQEHQNMVTCLNHSQRDQKWLIVTGSLGSQDCDFQVVLWIYNGYQLHPIHKLNLKTETTFCPIVSSRLGSPKKQRSVEVQSLVMSNSKILMGSSRGDIYEYTYDWIQKKQSNEEKPVMQIFSFEDGQRTKAMFFTGNEQQLVEISDTGLIRVWQLHDWRLAWSHNFQLQTVNMIISDKEELVVIAFKGEIRFFKWVEGQGKPSMVQIQEHYTQFNYITHLVLSHNQKFIALGIQRNSDKANLIQIYQISAKEFKFKLKLHLDSPILFIDFNKLTSDKAFMLIRTHLRTELFDLTQGISIQQDLVRRVDWLADGLLLSERTQIIRQLHQQDIHGCLIKKIFQVDCGYIIIDVQGGLHWYKDNKLTATCGLNISSIDCASLSPSMRYLAVGSKVDRNVVLIELIGPSAGKQNK